MRRRFGHRVGEPLDRDGDVRVDLPAEASGRLARRGDGDDPVTGCLADLGNSAKDFALAGAGLGGKEAEGAACELLDGGALLRRERHRGARDGSSDRLGRDCLGGGSLALSGRRDPPLRLDDDAGGPVVTAELLELPGELDAAEQQSKSVPGSRPCAASARVVRPSTAACSRFRNVGLSRSVSPAMTSASAAWRSIAGLAAMSGLGICAPPLASARRDYCSKAGAWPAPLTWRERTVRALRSAMVGGRPYSWMKRRTAAPTSSERAENTCRSRGLMPSTSK